MQNGQASVREQRLLVRDADEGGIPATVSVPQYCHLFVDGIEHASQVTVSSDHQYELRCDVIQPDTQIEVTESADGLSVTVSVHLTEGKQFRIADAPWSRQLELRLLEQPIAPSPPTADQIYQTVQGLGFVGTYDEAAVAELASCRRTTSRVVLRGRPAKPGRSPEYRLVPLTYHNDVLHRWRSVDTVKAGTVVAEYVAAQAGEDGMDVHGRTISAPMLGHPLPKLGEGLSLVDGVVVADRDGRFIGSRTMLTVVMQLVMSEDIVAKEGFIEFDGDITTTGSIMDGSVVRATGLISVYGSIYGADVIGFGGVRVGNSIVNSQVVAGSSGGHSADWQQAVTLAVGAVAALRQQITEAVRVQMQVRKEAEQGQRSMQSAHLVQHAKIALTDCVIALKQRLCELCSDIAPDEKVDDRWAELGHIIRGRWLNVQLADIRMDSLQSLEDGLLKYQKYLQSLFQDEPANVEAESIVSSTGPAARRCHRERPRHRLSSIVCGGVFRTTGFVRGGFCYCRKRGAHS